MGGTGSLSSFQLSISPLPAGLRLAEVCNPFRIWLRGIGTGKACFFRARAVHSHAAHWASDCSGLRHTAAITRVPVPGQNLNSCRPACSVRGMVHRHFGGVTLPSSLAMSLGRSWLYPCSSSGFCELNLISLLVPLTTGPGSAMGSLAN